jgi:predicted MFS family arabinose efflux permease
LVGGLAVLGVFLVAESRARAPQVALDMLSQATVKRGNVAALVVFSMESAFIFQMTLYLQDVLHFSPLRTGVIFGIPGLAAVAAGVVAGRVVGRYGFRVVLTVGLLAQATFVAPMVGAGESTCWLGVLMPCLFLGFFGHISAIVASMAAATSDVPDAKQGLATGLVSMSQLVGTTVGIPMLSAVAATRSSILSGMHAALACNVSVTVLAAALCWKGLNGTEGRTSGRVIPNADRLAA